MVVRSGREIAIMAKIKHHNLLGFVAAVFDQNVEIPFKLPALKHFHINLRDAYGGRIVEVAPQHMFRDIAYGLHYLHSKCDVSLSNILPESLPGGMWRGKISDFESRNIFEHNKMLEMGAIECAIPGMPGSSNSMPLSDIVNSLDSSPLGHPQMLQMQSLQQVSTTIIFLYAIIQTHEVRALREGCSVPP